MATNTLDQITGKGETVAMKAPCVVETTANITLSDEQTINSVAVVSGNRVLVKDQTDATENGIYIANTGLWTRAPDFNEIRDIANGTLVNIDRSGTSGYLYQFNYTGELVIGTTDLTFARTDSSIIAGDKLSRYATSTEAITANISDDIIHIDGVPYVAVGAEPTHEAKFEAGSWYELDPRHFDVAAFGATTAATHTANNTAFANAAAYCVAKGIKMKLPRGNFSVSDLGAMITPTGSLVVEGDESGLTEFSFDDTQGTDLFRRDEVDGTKSYLEFNNITLRGTWQSNQSPSGATEETRVFNTLIYSVTHLVFFNCNFYDLRDSAIEARLCDKVFVHGCNFEVVCRAGVNVGMCTNAIITSNNLKNLDDDAIACATSGSTTVTGVIIGQILIANNYIFDSPGINLPGIKNAMVANNVLVRPVYHGISVERFVVAGAPWSGDTANFGVQIKDNIIIDAMDTEEVYAYYTGAHYIRIKSADRTDDGDGRIPGRNTTSDSSFNITEEGFYTGGETGIKKAGNVGIKVGGNILLRTLYDTGSGVYSDQGYGQKFTRDGFVDPRVTILPADGPVGDTIAVGNSNGIQITGVHDNLEITNNLIRGARYAINGNNDSLLIRSRITNNQIIKAEFGILFAEIAGEAPFSVLVGWNDFDLDPEIEDSNRTGGTGWASADVAIALSANNVEGVTALGNTFANCSRPILMPATNIQHGNIIKGEPAALGFSTSNLGVGVATATDHGAWIYETVNSDLSSATYGQTTGSMVKSASSIPTSGFYLAGHFVKYNGTGTDIGWVRLTTGSGHVLDTDWTLIEGYTTAEKSKLSGIATSATANATDAALRDRATHTGAQAISTVTGLQTDLDNGRIQEIVDYTATGSDTLTISSTIVGANSVLFIDIFDSGDALELLVGDDSAFLTGASDYTYGFDAAGEATENSVDTTSAFMRVAFVGDASGIINITADGANKRASAITKSTHTGLSKIYNTHSYTNAASDITRLKFTGPSNTDVAINTRIVVKGYPA